MIPKPSSCDGCPFQHHGEYYTPDTIVPGSKVMFIAQNPGANEEQGRVLTKRHFHGGGEYTDEYTQSIPAPLIGATGQQFTNRFLPLAQLSRPEVSIGNAIRCRPGLSLGLKKADDLPPITVKMKLEHSSADIVNALKHCRDAHLRVPPTVDTIVTMGRYAMFQLTGIQHEETEYGQKQGVVESWRGYGVDVPSFSSWNSVDTSYYHDLRSSKRIFFLMHLAALNYGNNKRYMHATLQDFAKLRRLLDGHWPMPLPEWSTIPPTVWPSYSSFDTEYIPDLNNDTLIRWSMCDTNGNLYCVEADDTPDNIPIQPGSIVLAQNWLADYAHLSNMVDITKVKLEDMMLAHSVLWTGEPHNLNYIQSMYGSLNRTKHLNNDNPKLYSATDAHQPMYMWQHYFLPAFKADPLSWRVYKKWRLPLVPLINKSQIRGVPLETSRLIGIQNILQQRINRYKQEAIELTGDTSFKLSGRKQVMEYLYD